MKTKSLFISTIAMVVLLVVALATGTFAWYSSQNSATATDASLSTATSTTASIALGWADDATGNTVTFGTANVDPMIPTTLLADYNIGTTPSGTAPAFNGAILGRTPGGVPYFKSPLLTPAAWTQHNADATEDTLYLINLNTQASAVITTSLTLPSHVAEVDNNDILRVAVYAQLADSDDIKLIGVWGAGTIHYSEIVVYDGLGDYTASLESVIANDALKVITAVAGSASTIKFTVPKESNAIISIYAWFEGTELDTTRSSLSQVDGETDNRAHFSLSFTAATGA